MFDFFSSSKEGGGDASSKPSSSISTKEIQKNQDENVQVLMESILNIALAGFGGVLVGISLSKRGKSVTSLAKVSTRSARRRQVGTEAKEIVIDHDLPILMGTSCAAFALILEIVRKISPTSFLLSEMRGIRQSPLNEPTSKSIISITETTSWIDYTFGGALAGGIFRQIAVSTRTKTAERLIRRGKLPLGLNNIASPSYPSGVFVGTLLGFTAGGILLALNRLQSLVEENSRIDAADSTLESDFMSQKETPDEDLKKKDQNNEEIQNISAEELKQKIEDLKEKVRK